MFPLNGVNQQRIRLKLSWNLKSRENYVCFVCLLPLIVVFFSLISRKKHCIFSSVQPKCAIFIWIELVMWPYMPHLVISHLISLKNVMRNFLGIFERFIKVKRFPLRYLIAIFLLDENRGHGNPVTRVTEWLTHLLPCPGSQTYRHTVADSRFGAIPSHPCLVPTASAALILSLNRDLLVSKVITQAMVTGDWAILRLMGLKG